MIICVPITADTWIDAVSPDLNLGSLDSVEVRVLNLGGAKSEIARTLLYAAIPPEVISASIYAAFLCIYWNFIDASATATIYRVIRTGWTETGATYNKYDGVNVWGTAGCSNTTTDYDATENVGFVTPAAVSWQEIPITAWLKDIIDNHSREMHMKIQLANETSGTNIGGQIISRHNAVLWWGRPYIKIVCPPFGKPMEV